VVASVASGAGRAVGVETEVHFGDRDEDGRGRDEVPGLRLKDVDSEQVNLAGVVAAFATAAVAETAEISAAFAGTGGLHLHTQQVSVMFDADIVRETVSGGFEDVVSVEGG